MFTRIFKVFHKVPIGKQSVIFTWLVSYALILLIPVVISIFIYIQAARVVEAEINNSNLFLLKRVQQRMDGLIEDAVRLSQEISLNTRVNQLLRLDGAGKANPYEVYLAVQELKAYTLLNNSIEDFYIYYKNLDLALSSYTGNDGLSFFQAYYDNSGLSYQEWYRVSTEFYRGDFRLLGSPLKQTEASPKLAFVRTIPFFDRSGTSANIVIILDQARFLEDAKDVEALSKGTVLLIGRNNEILASTPSFKNFSGLNNQKIHEYSGKLHAKLNGQKVVISYINSQITGWKYLTVVPESVFWQKADYIRRLTYGGFVLCLLIGGFITFYALKKNYNPVSKLVKSLEKSLGWNFDQKNNEYLFIEQAIDKVYHDLEKGDAILRQQNKLLRSHFLTRLLQGKEDVQTLITERLAMHEIHFRSGYFAVMAFYIQDFTADLWNGEITNQETTDLNNLKKAQSIVTAVVEELIAEKNHGLVVDLDDLLLCLVNFEEGYVSGGKQELYRIAVTSRKLLRERCDLHLMVSAGSIQQSMENIPQSYHEALQAIEYKKLLGLEEMVFYEEIRELPRGSYDYPLEKEHQLINCIKTGDYQKAEFILSGIFKNNFEESVLPIKIAKCLMFNLIGTMIKTINEVNCLEDQGFLEELNPVERLLGCESINEMKSQMRFILKTFCDLINRKTKEKLKNRLDNADYRLMQKTLEYVQKNYQDGNMGIATIAVFFGVNPVHLSRVFTEQSGEGLLDFINRIRIEKAKQLFEEHRYNLDEVAQMTGYFSTRTFTRAFKKCEGVTPGKYQEAQNHQL